MGKQIYTMDLAKKQKAKMKARKEKIQKNYWENFEFVFLSSAFHIGERGKRIKKKITKTKIRISFCIVQNGSRKYINFYYKLLTSNFRV